MLLVPADDATRRQLAREQEVHEREFPRRYTRPHGEQPEPQHVSVVGACKWCERVPCEDHVHALWRAGLNGTCG